MSKFLKSLKVGSLFLHNRLVMPPMATSKAQQDGKVSQEIIGYYDEKSKGGDISLIIIEYSFVSAQGKASLNQLSIADDSMVENLKQLSKTIRKNGSKSIMQINHAGSATSMDVTGQMIVGPSAIENPKTKKSVSRKSTIPHALSDKEIAEIVLDFKKAALRVKEAGFDGVEIHSAHGFLLNQFLSPLTNKREDKYGGTIINRMRIHLEIIQAVRVAVGSSFPILLRLGASDYMDGGISIEDSLKVAREFEKAGVDILDISGGFCGFMIPNSVGVQGYLAHHTEAIKKVVSIPVILTGGIVEAKVAEKMIVDGKADLIGVGRAILHDSEWAKKAVASLK